jgi:hypothetical protein
MAGADVSVVETLHAARAAGVTVILDGETLLLEAAAEPPGAVLKALAQHKAEIVALLRPGQGGWSIEDWRVFFDERAAIAEFDGGLPREEAEARAFERCIVEWLNRNPCPSEPGRCAHCGGQEVSGAAVVPFGTEPGRHTWLHAECWSAWCHERTTEATKALQALSSQ